MNFWYLLFLKEENVFAMLNAIALVQKKKPIKVWWTMNPMVLHPIVSKIASP